MSAVKQIKKNTSATIVNNYYPQYSCNNSDYSVSLLSCIDDEEIEAEEQFIIKIKNSKILESRLSFDVNDLPNCCGVRECGNLSMSTNLPLTTATEILDGFVSKFKGITFIATTNGSGNNLLYEKAFIKCKYWTLVKSFKNKNTGRIIKVWVSNND